MLPPTTLIFLSSILILLLHSHPLSASNRRILHHPLLLSPLPPSEPPFPSHLHHRKTSVITSAPQPTLSTPDDTNLPFFPTYSPPPPLPPPPPPPPVLTSIPTFPANVSSLALPTTSAPSHSHSNKLIILTAAAVVALVSLIVFVFIIRRKSGRSSSELRPLYPHDTPTSDGRPPPPQPQPQLKLPNTSQTSSEFLYLGTVSAETSEFQVMPTVPTTSSFHEVVDERVYHLKLCGSGSSPELKPLPPLPRSSEFFRLAAGEQGGVSETTTRAEKFFHNNNVEEFFSPSNSSRHDDDDYFNNSGLKSCFSSSCHGSPSNNSQGRDSDDVSVEIQALAEKAEFVPAPPPPPPQTSRLSVGPPTLVPPSGPVVMKRSGNLSKSGERCEENGGIKPKLKALYWDKVRASSDRVTVWDQLHPGSFK